MVFLIWLCDRGFLRSEDVIEVLRACAARQKPLGRLAYEEGLMSKAEVAHVVHLQGKGSNERFGELAVEHGYLDQESLGRLLDAQIRRAPRPEDMLLTLGLLNTEQLAAARSMFLRAVDEGGVLAKPGPRTAVLPPVGARTVA